jgi:hypothetical protein
VIGWALRIICVLAVAIVAAMFMVPLNVLAERTRQEVPALDWTQVQGSVWSGRISNVRYGPQLVGDVELKLRPSALLSGNLVYSVSVVGPVASGDSDFYLNSGAAGIRNSDLTVRVDQLVGLNASVRQAGGSMRMTNMALEVDRDINCVEASGVLWTDALEKLGMEFGESLPQLEGALVCSGSMLSVALDGQSQTGVGVEIRTTVGLAQASSLNASIAGAGIELAQALTALGFTASGDEYVYVREMAP